MNPLTTQNMKKLLSLACTAAAVAFASTSHADTEGISYDYFEAGWALTTYDLDDFDDVNGGSLGLSVSIDDNAYISLFGTITDEASNAGAGVGLHHELVPTLDLVAEVGGFYEDISEDFGAYAELSARWLSCKWFELDAGVGIQYIESDTDFYGIFHAIVPVYKSLSIVASAMVEDHGQTYGAGFRLSF